MHVIYFVIFCCIKIVSFDVEKPTGAAIHTRDALWYCTRSHADF